MLDTIKDFIKVWDDEDSFRIYQVNNCVSIVVNEENLTSSAHTKWVYWALVNFLISNCTKCEGNCYFFEHEQIYLVV